MSNVNTDIPIWRRGDAYPSDWPEWLRAADIEWCQVEILLKDGRVEWYHGEWRDGEWHGGIWRDGVWRNGVWYGGVWYGGLWYDGTWLAGQWHDGKAWRTDGSPKSGGEA